MIQYFPIVTGSLTVLGNINVSGSITTSGSITISGSITSASFASTASFVALAQSASNAVAAQTASFVANAQTASYVLNAVSSSFASTASFVALAQSASNAVSSATASFANNLTVAGNLTAQTLVVQTITSSIDFVTGSTRFGSILGNTHVFSGSVTMNPNGLFVSSSGLVGIGNVVPAYTLDVSGTGRFTDNLTITIASGTKSIGFGGNTIAAAANALIYSDTNYLVLNSKAGSALYLNFDNANASSTINMFNGKFILTQAGNVGIGTVTPNLAADGKALTVSAGTSGNNLIGRFEVQGSRTETDAAFGGLYGWHQANLVGRVEFQRGSADNSGNIIFGTLNAGTYGQRMTITSAGNVGIGTNSPQSIVHALVNNATAPTSGTTPSGYALSYGTADGNNGGLWFSSDFGGDQGIAGIAASRVSGYTTDLRFYTNSTNSARAFTERMRITSAGIVELNGSDATYILYKYAGTSKAFIGVAGAISDVISGATAGDTVIRAQQSMRFSTGGDGERMRILSDFTLAGSGAGTGGPTQVIGTTAMVGILFVSIGTQSCAAIFIINAGNPPVLVSQTTSETRFSITNDNGNTANVYVSGTDIVLRNNIQATRAFYCQFFGKL